MLCVAGNVNHTCDHGGPKEFEVLRLEYRSKLLLNPLPPTATSPVPAAQVCPVFGSTGNGICGCFFCCSRSIIETYGKDAKPKELAEVLRLGHRSKLSFTF